MAGTLRLVNTGGSFGQTNLSAAGTTDRNINLPDASGTLLIAQSGQVAIPSGTAAAPGAHFVNDPDTGIYSESANQFYISTAGTEALNINTNQVTRLENSSNQQLRLRRQDGAAAANLGGGMLFQYLQTGSTVRNLAVIAGLKENGGDTDAAGYLQFQTTPSGSNSSTERWRITSSGILCGGTDASQGFTAGIGNGQYFQIKGSASNESSMALIRTSNNANGPILRIAKERNGGIIANNDILGNVSWYGNNGSGGYNEQVTLRATGRVNGGALAGGNFSIRLSDSSGSSTQEAAAFLFDGQMELGSLLGTVSSSAYGTRIGVGSSGQTLVGLVTTSRDVGNTGNVMNVFGSNGVLNVKGDGDCENTNGNYTGISDVRLKQDIRDINSQWEDIKAIRLRYFSLKENPTKKMIGVVAQEAAQICPGLVKDSYQGEVEGEEGDGAETIKAFSYSILHTKAVGALQEAMARIETLEAEVAALKAV